MDTQNVVFVYNRILCSLEKEGILTHGYNIDLGYIMLSEVGKSHTKNILYDSIYMKYIE